MIPTLSGGGAERQLSLMLPLFVEAGLETSVLSHIQPPMRTLLTDAGVIVHELPAGRAGGIAALNTIRKSMALTKPDIVQTWLPRMDIIGGTLAMIHKVPWILSERSSAAAYPPTFKNSVRKMLGSRSARVIANSPSGAEYWHAHRHSTVIGNGLDFDALDRDATDPNLPGVSFAGRRVVLSVGRLTEEKQTDVVIRAVAHARLRFPDVLLVIVGDGHLERQYRELVATLGIDENVHFAGFRHNVWGLMRAAELVVSSSAFEGHPNAVLETAALGTPLILSEIRMHRDTIGEHALFCPDTDVVCFADAIVSVLSNPDAAKKRAVAAQESIRHHSIANVAERYVKLYRSLKRDC